MEIVGLLVAGGNSRRLGGGTNKALRQCQGKALIVHAAAALLASGQIAHLVIATRESDIPAMGEVLAAEFTGRCSWEIVVGGRERQASVAAALAAAPPAATHVLVHDAARPFTPPAVVSRVLAALAHCDAVIPVVSVVDTIKRVRDDHVVATLDRQRLRAVQTPQGFARALLEQALRQAASEHILGTDDAALVERLGVTVHCVEGAMENRKVTVPEDDSWLPEPLQ